MNESWKTEENGGRSYGRNKSNGSGGGKGRESGSGVGKGREGGSGRGKGREFGSGGEKGRQSGSGVGKGREGGSGGGKGREFVSGAGKGREGGSGGGKEREGGSDGRNGREDSGGENYKRNGGYSQGGYRSNYGKSDEQKQNYGGSGSGGGRSGRNFINGPASSHIEIDSNKVGLVIGRGGEKIREIQDNFKVYIKVDRNPGPNGCSGVTIKGEEDAIQQATQCIQTLVAVKYFRGHKRRIGLKLFKSMPSAHRYNNESRSEQTCEPIPSNHEDASVATISDEPIPLKCDNKNESRSEQPLEQIPSKCKDNNVTKQSCDAVKSDDLGGSGDSAIVDIPINTIDLDRCTNDHCDICLDSKTENIQRLASCEHTFHIECMEVLIKAFQPKPECPLCHKYIKLI